MKTNDLVTLLSSNHEPVDHRLVARTLYVALGAGSVVSLGIMFIGLGVRSDLTTVQALIFLAVKLLFAVGIVSLASVYLIRLARPGGEHKNPSFLIAIPFLVITLLAAISLWLAPSSHWDNRIRGGGWLECLVSIPIIAVIPFAIAIWAVRKAAPTDLARTGAVAGLAAGGVSAMAYALHCADDSFPFVAVWYGGMIVLCTVAGAILGPRLLRWS
jgi:hypothetical protein